MSDLNKIVIGGVILLSLLGMVVYIISLFWLEILILICVIVMWGLSFAIIKYVLDCLLIFIEFLSNKFL